MTNIWTLFWLRTKQYLANKELLIQILLPYGFVTLYSKLMNIKGQDGLPLLFMFIAMSFSIGIGIPIATIVSKEKEENNLKSLFLAGVSHIEYIIGSIIYPFLLTLMTIFILPLITQTNILDITHLGAYLGVMLLTSINIVLLNSVIAMLADTQAKAKVYGFPIMFLIMMLPILSHTSDYIELVGKYSFMGSYIHFFNNIETFHLISTDILSVIVWLVGLLILNAIIFNHNH